MNIIFKMNVATRAGEEENDYFQNEQNISHVEIFFFDAENGNFVTRIALDDLYQDYDPLTSYYDVTYISKEFPVEAGVYNIFAVANHDHLPDVIAHQEELLNMTDSLTYNTGIEAYIPDTGPVMTSLPMELLAVDLRPWIGKDYIFTIKMERVLAKLQIGVSQNRFELRHQERKYADINITNYKLVNLNTRYYLFQHHDSMTQLTEMPQFQLPDHFSPYTAQDNTYVVDPLFYRKTPVRNDALHFSSYYASWFGFFTTYQFASMPTAGRYGYAYLLENTAFSSSQKNGYSPGVVVKAAVSPTSVYLYDAKTRTLQEEVRPEYWPNTLYLYNFNFYGSLQAINMASALGLDELLTYTDAQLSTYGIKQCKFNMGTYETYYTYWIQHRRDADPMAPMNYAIVRNNFYKLTVTGISGLGNSIIQPDILRDNYPNSYVDIEQ